MNEPKPLGKAVNLQKNPNGPEAFSSLRLIQAMFFGMADDATKWGSDTAPQMPMLYLLGRHWSFGHTVELGVGRGWSTVALLAGVFESGKKLISYDSDELAADAAAAAMNLPKDDEALSHWEFRSKHSVVAVEDFPDESVSLLFLDTTREYADTRDELGLWAPKMHPKGVMCGQGYLLPDENVKRAVDEFAEEYKDRFSLEVTKSGIGFYMLWPRSEADARRYLTSSADRLPWADSPPPYPKEPSSKAHRGGVIWLSGVASSEKAVLAGILAERLLRRGSEIEVLDEEGVRDRWPGNEDPEKKVLGVARLAASFARHGVWALVSIDSPKRAPREKARAICADVGSAFFEVYIRPPEEQGTPNSFEAPDSPDQVVETEDTTPHEVAVKILDTLVIRSQNPPVIVLGKGHSGTRLLSQIAQDCGVFIGGPGWVSETQDSLEWVDLIYKMVFETRETLDLPQGSKYRQEILDTARRILSTNGIPFENLWGWKLPETTLVLPLILDAFPGARILHIVRHPISASLRKHHITADPGHPVGEAALYGAYRYAGRDPAFAPFDENWRRSAYTWIHQVSRIAHYGRTQVNPANYLEIRYEDVCDRPEQAVLDVANFLKVGTPNRFFPSFVVDRKRMNPWKNGDPRAEEIWELCGRLAGLFRYGLKEQTYFE